MALIWIFPQIVSYLESTGVWTKGMPLLAAVNDAAIGPIETVDPKTGAVTRRGTPPAQLWADQAQSVVVAPAGRVRQVVDPANPDGPSVLVVEKPAEAGPDWEPWVVFKSRTTQGDAGSTGGDESAAGSDVDRGSGSNAATEGKVGPVVPFIEDSSSSVLDEVIAEHGVNLSRSLVEKAWA